MKATAVAIVRSAGGNNALSWQAKEEKEEEVWRLLMKNKQPSYEGAVNLDEYGSVPDWSGMGGGMSATKIGW